MGKWRDVWMQDMQDSPSDERANPISGMSSTDDLHAYLHHQQLSNVPCHSLRECCNLVNRYLVQKEYGKTNKITDILDADGYGGVMYLPCTDDDLLVYCEDTQTFYGELPNGTELVPIHFNG